MHHFIEDHFLKLPKGTTPRTREIRLRENSPHSRGKLDVGVHQTKGVTPATREHRAKITGDVFKTRSEHGY
jgi:hypothetical protein